LFIFYIHILQGSAATQLRCGGIFNNPFIANGWRDGYYWRDMPIGSCQRPIQSRWYHRLLFKTYRLVTIPHDWHTIMRYNPLRSSKVNDFYVIRKPICDFLLVINSNPRPYFAPFSHNTSVTDKRRRQTTVPKTPKALCVARQKANRKRETMEYAPMAQCGLTCLYIYRPNLRALQFTCGRNIIVITRFVRRSAAARAGRHQFAIKRKRMTSAAVQSTLWAARQEHTPTQIDQRWWISSDDFREPRKARCLDL